MLGALLQEACTVLVVEDSHLCDDASSRVLKRMRACRVALKVYLFTVPGIRITRERRLRRLSKVYLEVFGRGVLASPVPQESLLVIEVSLTTCARS